MADRRSDRLTPLPLVAKERSDQTLVKGVCVSAFTRDSVSNARLVEGLKAAAKKSGPGFVAVRQTVVQQQISVKKYNHKI
jgi:hypothetical protein